MSNIHKIGLIILFSVVMLTSTSAINQVSGFVQPAFVSKFGSRSCDRDGELNLPSGIAVDNNGNVYVCDTISRIQKFDENGNYLTKWSSVGCLGIDIDKDNYVFVAGTTQHKVSKYNSNGTLIKEWGTYGSGI